MPLDFSKIAAPSTADTVVNPRDIFAILPGKQPKYGYLRDVQSEVLDQWFARRTTTDLRLKMNTGGGKTVVGLLVLKSCLNEGKGPSVYVAPTPYLASQVIHEARALGLAVEEDPRSVAVARGKAILVTSIYVLLNGKSKFGVGALGVQIPIGSLILDDAHACLATAEEQFTLDLAASHPVYASLFSLFRSDLEAQSSSAVLDVEQHEPYRQMLVPFWAWLDKLKHVEVILHEVRDDDDVKFVWPLLRDYLKQCRCVFGGGHVEISPRCLPVDVVPSFARACRRIFMSATFADDSVLVTHFDARPADIATAIAPGSASDIGDRMILVPQELDPSITDEQIKALLAEKSKTYNVVVIVPSNHRAKFWEDVASLTLKADGLEEGVSQLHQGHVGLTVLINKYDGIDLPHDACRILVLDGLPSARRAIDQIEQGSMLHGTSLEVGKSVQQMEQGMGRGVRASDDFCVVLLMGRSLTGHLFTRSGISRLTPATRAQFDLSEEVGNQVRNKEIREIGATMDYCLTRNAEWVKAAKSALVHVKYATTSSDLRIAVARRTAFDAVAMNDQPAAARAIQDEVNAATEPAVKGWLMAELAEYTHPASAVEAQQILRSAVQLNRQLIHPLAGIDYTRLSPQVGEQAVASLTYIREQFNKPNDLVVAANSISDRLAFRPNSYRQFHRAMREAALILGFGAQFPEADYGSGPDVLWAVGGLRYFVIECKNEATTDTVNKKDCNQLAGSMNWFGAKYDTTCSAVPLLVHPAFAFEHAATPPPGARVMTSDRLPLFRQAFVKYCVAVSRLADFGQPKDVASLLTVYQLLPGALLATYTVAAWVK
ncbi:MAG: DEAD/DEAH box helicase [Phycisphaerales bacterium]